jgi:lysophospholipase L1-like esterase
MCWVGTWTTSPAPLAGHAFANQTLRMIAHASIGGENVRVRLSNAFGTRPIDICAARIALRAFGSAINPETDRQLTFGGESFVRIAAGSLAVSDPVSLDLPPLADVAVSFHVPGEIDEVFGITGHGTAKQTNFVSVTGNHSSATELPIERTIESLFFLSGIEVEAPPGTRGLVAFGDSLTDANISTPDTNSRWPDQVARRLMARDGRCRVGIMNQGIGGNRLLHDLTGDSGLKRFDSDVLAQPGVSHVIVLLGVNDLRNRRGDPAEVITSAQLIAGYRQLCLRAHSRGLKIYGATILPYENETFLPGAWSPEREEKRQAINAWIRTGGAFDAVIDLDRALCNPDYPSRLLPEYDCGDHLHPSDLGYCRIGDAIDLALLD